MRGSLLQCSYVSFVPEGDIRGANSNTDRNSSEVATSFDHFVGTEQNRRRYSEAERLGGLGVHDHHEFDR